MSKYVKITSQITIFVTGGLDSIDATNLEAHIPDRLNIKPAWTKSRILIKAGTGIYPAEIAEWNTVKALVKERRMSISYDVEDATEEEKQIADEAQSNIDEQKEQAGKRKRKQIAQINLDEIADSEEK